MAVEGRQEETMTAKVVDLLVRACLHLVTALICAGILYLCWHFVGARIRLDFPENTLGGALEFPVQLACTALLSMSFGQIFLALALDLPRKIRRKHFWQRKNG